MARVPGLAEALDRHGIECLVFLRGGARQEVTALGAGLAALTDTVDPRGWREQLQSSVAHVLLRFVELRDHKAERATFGGNQSFVPDVSAALSDAARAMVQGERVDEESIRAIARRMVARAIARDYLLTPRSYAEGIDDQGTHAANVALMTAAMMHEARVPEEACVEATSAAIVHDVGQLLLPEAIRGVPFPLLDERGQKYFPTTRSSARAR